MADIVYWVNAQDEIVDVGGDWQSAAEEQGCFSLDRQIVIGRSLFDFIEGDSTVMFVVAMLKRVRLLKDTIERDYRCDTPTLRRHMKMTITYEEEERIKISHEEISSELRSSVCEFHTAIDKAIKKFKRCSMCGRISNGGDWLEADTEFPNQKDFNVFYGVCPQCMMGQWRNPA